MEIVENKQFDYTDAYKPEMMKLTERQKRRRRIKKRVFYVLKIINYLIMIFVGITFLYPFAWMLSMSLRTREAAMSFAPDLIVSNPQWHNYIDAWNKAKFGNYIGNSITYALLVLSLQYLTIIPAAYAFARLKFKGNKSLWAVKTLGMMLPGEATLIPVYFFYSKMGLVNTWTGLVLPSLFSMFGIYMFMNNFKTIPNEIIESAKMDKAKNRTIMIKIMVPIIFPVFITHLLLTFISNWNEYFWVLIMANDEKIQTLPVAIRGLLKAEGIMPPWHTVMAGNLMQLAPILLMYVFASQQIKTAMIGGRKIKNPHRKQNLVMWSINSIKKLFTRKDQVQGPVINR